MIGGGRQAVRYLSRGGGAGRGRRGRGRGGGGWGGRDGRASRPTMKLKTATAEDGGEVDEDVDKVVPVDKFGVARARDGDAEDANLTPSMALEKAIASLPPPIPTNVKEHEEFYKKRWQRRWPEWDTVEMTPGEQYPEILQKTFTDLKSDLANCGHFHDKQKHAMLDLASKLLSQDFSGAKMSWDE